MCSKSISVALVIGLTTFFQMNSTQAKPLKIFILAGQSNMDGHAKVSTFDYIGDDPATTPLLGDMLGPDGKPKVCDDVWIDLYTGNRELGEVHGNLTSGYGARLKFDESEDKIGPEFTFGIYMQKHVKEPILIIKTSWGGKSLNTDFRPPSAGPFELPALTREKWEKHPDGGNGVPKESERVKWWEKKHRETGVYYRMMIDHVKEVLSDVGRVCPAYDPESGYELAGFVWFQGWNDMADATTYPNADKPGGFKEYTNLMGHLIRDVRNDLKAPEMPFVIGVIGVFGNEPNKRWSCKRVFNLRPAMAAVAELPEFRDNVIAVETAPFWDKKLAAIEEKNVKVEQMMWNLRRKNPNFANKDGKMTPKQRREYLKEYEAKVITPEEKAVWERGASNGAYHYMGSAKIVAQIGKAFADALATRTLANDQESEKRYDDR